MRRRREGLAASGQPADDERESPTVSLPSVADASEEEPRRVMSAPGPRERPRPVAASHATNVNKLDALSLIVAKLQDDANWFYATALCPLPLYDAVPHTPTQLQNNVSGGVEEGRTYRVSYPQVDGACKLMFMKVWAIDATTADITARWVPFAIGEGFEGDEARRLLTLPEDKYIFMGDCKFHTLE
jgi:hypothetical protein